MINVDKFLGLKLTEAAKLCKENHMVYRVIVNGDFSQINVDNNITNRVNFEIKDEIIIGAKIG